MMCRSHTRPALLAAVTSLAVSLASPLTAGPPLAAASGSSQDTPLPVAPNLAELISGESSELRDVVARYSLDREGLLRKHDVAYSAERQARARAFYQEWLEAIDTLDFDALGADGRIDWLLLRNQLRYELARLDREQRQLSETAELVPFLDAVTALQVSRRQMEPVDPETSARDLAELAEVVERVQRAVAAGEKGDAQDEIVPIETTLTVAYRASRLVASLRQTLKQWFEYYQGYDPLFTWWVGKPYQELASRLEAYEKHLREEIVGFRPGSDDPIVGDPIGREALLVDLAREMIPYTPEQLLAIAERELAWCDEQMLRASRELGYGDDWRAALEHVKGLHVEPGAQPALIRDQALEAVAFVEERDLLTIPPLAKQMWRIEMMSPERQKVNPFFLGGEVIQVSFPTDTMTHEEKMMSMRGNNIHFARATVHHELIPGHHLQGFMNDRYNSHRSAFRTPFWTEGWALYWEMRLWDLDFPQTPENRIGMLFWRMHRCARIIFSLGFHLGRMSPQECIDFLVERVGHERNNATAEVRRSFEGSYPPLYQAAYMLGGLQFRALRDEIVGSGRMTDKQFHDAVLRLNRMPLELLRARLTDRPIPKDFAAEWAFAGELP